MMNKISYTIYLIGVESDMAFGVAWNGFNAIQWTYDLQTEKPRIIEGIVELTSFTDALESMLDKMSDDIIAGAYDEYEKRSEEAAYLLTMWD